MSTKTPEQIAKAKEYQRAWQAKNAEKMRQYHRERYYADVEAAREKCRAWRAANLEQERERKRIYMAHRRTEKPDEISECKKRYAYGNREHLNAAAKRRYRSNPDKFRARYRRWRIAKNGISRDQEKLLLSRVHVCVPKTLPRDIRDEVVGMMFLAIYEGRFPRRVTPEHAKILITEHYRQFSKFDTVSLDAVIGEDGYTRGAAMGIY